MFAITETSTSQRLQLYKRPFESFPDTCIGYDCSVLDSNDISAAKTLMSLADEHARLTISAPYASKIKLTPKLECVACGNTSSLIRCSRIILNEIEAEFHPTGDLFVQMVESLIHHYHLRHNLDEQNPICRSILSKMIRHRTHRSSVLSRLLFSMLRDAVSMYRPSMSSSPKSVRVVRLEFVRKELCIGEDVLPSRFLNESFFRVQHMEALLHGFMTHKPERLRIPASLTVFYRNKMS